MRHEKLQHEFVDAIPDDVREGVLYISVRYRTATHLCACRCGNKVVTPIKPPKWHLTFDGDTVSLSPSIGNWQLPCRSHYWIRNGNVKWAKGWTDEEIEAGRARDKEVLRQYYGEPAKTEAATPTAPAFGLTERLSRWFRRIWK